jgi:cyclic dehypoxanthinyl futalosine synthase
MTGRETAERVSADEALDLLLKADLHELARRADARCRRLHPEPYRTFAIDRNINFTNVCACRCRFCAFWRGPDDVEAYVLDEAALAEKVAEAVRLGATHVLMQGGVHPGLDLAFYERMFRGIRGRFDVAVHAMSPPEIGALAEREGKPVREVLERLRAAGLDSLPGGGAEILVDRVRRIVSPRKGTAEAWLEVMRQAHRLGMPTTATMVFGHVETPAERIEHLVRIRSLQDEALGTAPADRLPDGRLRGFQSFILWPFQPRGTRLAREGRLPPGWHEATGVEYLRLVAVARLVLDNVANLQVSWVTMGFRIGEVALAFGANDAGSTMMEENVVSAAERERRTDSRASEAVAATPDELRAMIRAAGFEPRQRDCYYRVAKT